LTLRLAQDGIRRAKRLAVVLAYMIVLAGLTLKSKKIVFSIKGKLGHH
jgi:hypothetical protein